MILENNVFLYINIRTEMNKGKKTLINYKKNE